MIHVIPHVLTCFTQCFMKKSLTYAIAVTLLFAFSPAVISASVTSGLPTVTDIGINKSISINAINNRLSAIKDLDKSCLNAGERRCLRKEARSLRNQRRQLNDGVYLSGGAIILLVVLLIILL
jgi:hypothetical protein